MVVVNLDIMEIMPPTYPLPPLILALSPRLLLVSTLPASFAAKPALESNDALVDLLGAIQGEKVRQAVQAFDPKSTGFIEVANFQRIVQETAGHKLSDHILDNLSIFISVGVASKIPCANVRAFQTVVREMDTIDTIVKECNRQIQG
ncbi:Similar to olfactory receptor [Exophiala dermatitidis NIH/UT8656]; acc. no. EHY59640 [Pyronema omphalodes CBS 100304]|uniref:Similar to olfactory receptor [Exophiala dermatitidis NIH/UT8656] acc. no. EHY59640 n=1 Tax=Pyronema omphalodes (strain CBS 100304) TaxID=1076935 RepID=U4LNH9_PYROM|nr:Similar to olfactory receptor [Exophiala dermatitidis NIH/UT8656]; acc. no. EHY59640 [Pyronema omphalodes CBS 100304]